MSSRISQRGCGVCIYATLFVTAGCIDTQTKKQTSPSTAAPANHTVLVMDKGFDLTHPVFKDKVVDSFTIRCTESNEPRKVGLSVAQMKVNMLKELASPSEACQIVPGVTLKKSPSFDGIATLRDRWNKAVMGKESLTEISNDPDSLNSILEGEKGYLYHGTATAGLIAYQNPGVRLVIVEQESVQASADEAVDEIECISQTEIDNSIAVLHDAEVIKAYTQLPPSSAETALVDIARRYSVTLLSYSVGPQPTAVLEKMIKDKCGSSPSYGEYFAVLDALDQQASAWKDSQGFNQGLEGVLEIHAAGNESTRIDSIRDFSGCPATDDATVLIGSYDVDGKISSFSNFGNCVAAYALGQSVVVAAPNGFLAIESGTSFSTPLTTRLITQKFRPVADFRQMKSQLSAIRDQSGYLSLNDLPEELAFKGTGTIDSYSLTGNSLSRGSLSDRRLLHPLDSRLPGRTVRIPRRH